MERLWIPSEVCSGHNRSSVVGKHDDEDDEDGEIKILMLHLLLHYKKCPQIVESNMTDRCR